MDGRRIMKKFSLLAFTLLATAFAQGEYQSNDYHLADLNFAAPTVFGDPLNTNSQVGSIVYDLNTNSFRGLYASGSWSGISQGSITAPAVRVLANSGTYSPPTGVLYIKVKLVGGGGGGSGSANSSNNAGSGSAGGNTTFGTSLLTANGGNGGTAGAASGGAGGTASVSTSSTVLQLSATQGGNGQGGGTYNGVTSIAVVGGQGASTPLGGNGGGGQANGNSNVAAQTNSGSGGGGAGAPATGVGGAGGGAGGYVEAIITNPGANYSYVVGGTGSPGAAGSGGYAGGTGGAGTIIIEEHYQ